MNFEPSQLYHIYNQGNNRQKIFLSDNDYSTFLAYVKVLILPFAEIIAYCFMPNHFHFLIYANEHSCRMVKQGGVLITSLSNGFRKLLSGYCRVFNSKHQRSGSLFRQKTKAKCLTEWEPAKSDCSLQDYCSNCFRYIHNNPLSAGLVKLASDWIWSSYRFYAGIESEGICSMEKAKKFCGIDIKDLIDDREIDERWVKVFEEDTLL